MTEKPKPTKDQAPVWLRELMKKAHESAEGQRELAEILGVKQPNIGKYLSGRQIPSITVIERLLHHMGGDILKALPGHNESQKRERTVVYEDLESYGSIDQTNSNRIFISGQVQAGNVSLAGEDQHFREVDALWGKSRFWSLTAGPVVYIEVVGDSMAPDYRPGEVLACRAPVSPGELPSGTPCIFQEHQEDGLTFKILRYTDSGNVVGQPVNPDYPMVIFKKNAARIPLVVLGKVQLEKRTASKAVSEVKSKAKNTKKS